MGSYEVTAACYVPVGPGFKYKKPGQEVTLTKAQAKKLGDFVKSLDDEDEEASKADKPAKDEKPAKPDEKGEPTRDAAIESAKAEPDQPSSLS